MRQALITAIDPDDEVSIVHIHGEHHPAVIHEVLDTLAECKLDVLHADIVQPNDTSKEDSSVFYVRNVDSDTELPPATDRARRRAVRDRLTGILAQHSLRGHASVRPLDNSRPNVLSTRPSAADFDESSLPLSRPASFREGSAGASSSRARSPARTRH